MRTRTAPVFACFTAVAAMIGTPGPSARAQPEPPLAEFVRRPLAPPTTGGDVWGGAGVCYSAFRDGQSPNGALPTSEHVREDLRILRRHWRMLRMYGSRGVTEQVCRIIREDKLPLRVMVGAWIAQESKPDATAESASIAAENRAEVDTAVRLANEYPDVVFAINIGNEALVEWSDHRVHPRVIIGYLRRARAGVNVPVTTCDTEMFWTRPESVEVARECDFLGLHAYAMWNKQHLAEAMQWTRDRIGAVHTLHPDPPIVLCETGWATCKGTEGYQAIGIAATPDERDQELFFRALRDWAVEAGQPYFYFEAFDENWKGGNDPADVEKHWGVYNADRSPKALFRDTIGGHPSPARPAK